MKKNIFALGPVLLAACTATVAAETAAGFSGDAIPLKKVTLYSSGVAHYVHEGSVSGSGTVELLFSPQQINDVLKSLVVADSAAKQVSVHYQSEDTLRKTLESLKVNLASSSTLYDILKAQKGAEIEVFTPHRLTGCIVSVDQNDGGSESASCLLSLAAEDGVHMIPFSDIQSFRFTDTKRNEDLHTALALLLDASAKNRKKLDIKIDAQGERTIKLAYIMEAPVWKASYRLGMGAGQAAFQAWAIVDNSTDLDWNSITLTLTTGRPVGFRQNLFAPYYTYRPELPLAIAQTAEAETFDSGLKESQARYGAGIRAAERRPMPERLAATPYAAYDNEQDFDDEASSDYVKNQAKAGEVGEMFAFTPSNPITLERQKSMMIPLTLASVPAEKCSVFSSITSGASVHPKFCVHIENTSGLKLPAGPITVFDEDGYVGDALLEFLPEGEKRLIAYGDDLEVSGTVADGTVRNIETVKMADGVLSILYRQVQTSTYRIKNTDKKERTVIIERVKQAGFELAATDALFETTANKYRFKLKAVGGGVSELSIAESRTYRNETKIIDMRSDAFISYAANAEMPTSIKKAFETIIQEKAKVEAAQKTLEALQNRHTTIAAEQDRVRKNLEAVGSESQQGKAFLDKLLQLESELDTLKTGITDADGKLQQAQGDFASLIKNIKTE